MSEFRTVLSRITVLLEKEQDDANLVLELCKAAYHALSVDTAVALKAIEKAFTLAHKNHSNFDLAHVHKIKGLYFYYVYDFESAVEENVQATIHCSRLGDSRMMTIIQSQLAMCYGKMNLLETQIRIEKRCIQFTHREKYPDYRSILATSHLNIGNALSMLGRAKDAVEYFMKALDIAEQTNNNNAKALTYTALGREFQDHGYLEKAKHYSELGLDLFTKLGNDRGIAHNTCNLGIVYEKMDQLEQASNYFQTSTKQFETLDDHEDLVITYLNLSAVRMKQNRFPEGLALMQKGTTLGLKFNYHKTPRHAEAVYSYLHKEIDKLLNDRESKNQLLANIQSQLNVLSQKKSALPSTQKDEHEKLSHQISDHFLDFPSDQLSIMNRVDKTLIDRILNNPMPFKQLEIIVICQIWLDPNIRVKQHAQMLNVSEKSLKNYRSSIRKKLGIHTKMNLNLELLKLSSSQPET